MNRLIRKQFGRHKFSSISKLAIVAFIISLAASLIDTIWAVYMDSFIHSEVWVGFISAALTLISLMSSFVFIPFIEKSNKSKLFANSLLLFASFYFLFALNKTFIFFIVLAVLITLIYNLRVTSIGILIKDNSSEKQLSKNEGLVYTFLNLAWVIGPLIAALLLVKFNSALGNNMIFILSAVLILIGFLFFKISKIKDSNITKKPHTKLKENFIAFFKDKNRVLAYVIGGGVSLWWTLIYLFIPLHMIRSGISESYIGFFFFAIAFPLLISTYKFSKMAGEYGFKKFFIFGFFILSLVAFASFFIINIYIMLLLLVIGSFGIAMIEATSEAYFFDILTGNKEEKGSRFYGPYSTTIDVNHFIGRISSSILLIFRPFKFIFLSDSYHSWATLKTSSIEVTPSNALR